MAPPAAASEPVNTSLPVISGTVEPEHTLTATTGSWTDTSPIVEYKYQWMRCVVDECVYIDYADNSTYKIPWELEHAEELAVTVFATDAQGETGLARSEVTGQISYNGPRYTVSESTVGNGSVKGFVSFAGKRTADGNLGCPGACGARYPYVPGGTFELIATTEPGFAFLGWRGACVSTAPTCTFTLSGNESVTALFTGQTTTTPVLAPEPEGQLGETPAFGGTAPIPEARKTHISTRLPARLVGIHALHHDIHALVRCQQTRPCRLRLALFASTPAGQAVIAQRSFIIAARRSVRVTLALNRLGARLLAKRHQLRVTAQLMLSAGRSSMLIEQVHLTLTV